VVRPLRGFRSSLGKGQGGQVGSISSCNMRRSA